MSVELGVPVTESESKKLEPAGARASAAAAAAHARKPPALHGLVERVIFCSRCVMSNQRPSTAPELKKSTTAIETAAFDEDGVCHACRYHDEVKPKIDWKGREEQLVALLDRHRRANGHDVIVPGSGGKDSAYVSHFLKHRYGMNPLTVTWAPHIYTDIGWRNFQSWLSKGGFDNILVTPNPKVHGLLTRLAFTRLLNPFQPFIIGQKVLAPKIAHQHGVPLIMYGENHAEYHNKMSEHSSPLMSLAHYTAKAGDKHYFGGVHEDELAQHGVHSKELEVYRPLDIEVAERAKLEVHYISYYLRHTPQENYYYAVENCGFEANAERSEGTYSKYASLDDKIDGFHYYTMFIKFGQGRAMNDAAHEIRDRHITREEGVALVKKFDGEFPRRHFNEFLAYTGISETEFWECIDRGRSPHLWGIEDGRWVLKRRVT